MSNAGSWGAETQASPLIRGHAATLLREATLDHRLSALREVALQVLNEVESLGNAQLSPASHELRLHDEVRQFEIDLIRIALDRTHGNQTQAASLLGVKLTTLNTKIKRYKIEYAGQKIECDEPR